MKGLLFVGLAFSLGQAWPVLGLESTTPSSEAVEKGNSCETNEECGESLICDTQTSMCQCKDSALVLSPSGHCMTSKHLEERCTFSDQCIVNQKHSICRAGVCVCNEGFVIQNDNKNASTCIVQSRQKHVPKTFIDPNMIIIMSVLAIMFVGICVALHLFSRARFRNRRTIFNSPHPRLMHIKLGKRRASQARRHSHASLPVPASRHHSISSQTSPSRSRTASIAGTRTLSHDNLRSPKKSPTEEKKKAPLAENESLPSSEDLDKKSPDDPITRTILTTLQNGVNSPTVIITSESGRRTLAKSPSPPAHV